MRNIEEINREIESLREKLGQLEGRPTEVYTRIVGYYRSLRNWNLGKREEYNHRVLFCQSPEQVEGRAMAIPTASEEMVQAAPSADAKPVRFMYFFRQTCPNCPAVRSLLTHVDLPGCDVDVDTTEGTEAALLYNIYSTPTAIFFDANSQELFRATSTEDLRQKLPEGLLAIPRTA